MRALPANDASLRPQGINRLGKAAPRPGSLRPPDPTRNRITDHFSENVEGLESDRDYQRAVQDVSDGKDHIVSGLATVSKGVRCLSTHETEGCCNADRGCAADTGMVVWARR